MAHITSNSSTGTLNPEGSCWDLESYNLNTPFNLVDRFLGGPTQKLEHQPTTLRVQVPKNHVLTQNLYYNYYYQNPKYPILGYMDP